jgi:hypothetical protein
MYSRKTPGDGQRRCPKQVEVYNNKIWIIGLVGYLKRNHALSCLKCSRHAHLNIV